MTVSSVGRPTSPPVKPQTANAGGTQGATSQAAKLFSFGLVSDVQHADIPDGFSFHGVPRYYRQALAGLERAMEHFQQEQVSFAVHLGDIIDYHNSVTPSDEGSDISKSEQALRNVLQRFERLQLPVLHMLGNHCLYNHPRDELNRRLGE